MSVLVTAKVMRYSWSPSKSESSTPVTVTVCAVLQSVTVKVSAAGDTVPSPESLLVRPTLTCADGGVASATWNMSRPPASVVPRSAASVTTTAAPTTVPVAGKAGLVRVSPVPSPSVKLTLTLIFLPASPAAST